MTDMVVGFVSLSFLLITFCFSNFTQAAEEFVYVASQVSECIAGTMDVEVPGLGVDVGAWIGDFFGDILGWVTPADVQIPGIGLDFDTDADEVLRVRLPFLRSISILVLSETRTRFQFLRKRQFLASFRWIHNDVRYDLCHSSQSGILHFGESAMETWNGWNGETFYRIPLGHWNLFHPLGRCQSSYLRYQSLVWNEHHGSGDQDPTLRPVPIELFVRLCPSRTRYYEQYVS